jgi:hypothetical protein
VGTFALLDAPADWMPATPETTSAALLSAATPIAARLRMVMSWVLPRCEQ